MKRMRIARVGPLVAGLLIQSCGRPQVSPGASLAAPRAVASSQPAARRVVELALGDRHSCARLATGQVMCWGDNRYGQLGDGTGRPSSIPVLARGIEDAVQLSSSQNTNCVRRATGAVLCWGSNDRGQVIPERTRTANAFKLDPASITGSDERSTADPFNVRPMPTLVPATTQTASITLGLGHTCAARSDGSVWCWGDNSVGQLGGGASAEPFQLQRAAISDEVVDVRAAGLYSCARTQRGAVWCWGGYNESEQLGHAGSSSAPTRVAGVSASIDLSLDPSRACSRQRDGHWLCWGTSARCAEAAPLQRPTEDPRLRDVTQVAVAYNACFRCYLRPSGAVECSFTEQGHDGVLPLPAIERLVAGTEHACALARAGDVFCWGNNAAGQLGRDTPQDFDATPKQVTFEVQPGEAK